MNKLEFYLRSLEESDKRMMVKAAAVHDILIEHNEYLFIEWFDAFIDIKTEEERVKNVFMMLTNDTFNNKCVTSFMRTEAGENARKEVANALFELWMHAKDFKHTKPRKTSVKKEEVQ